MGNSLYENGVKAFNEKRYGLAKSLFIQAIDENPEVAESHLYLGKCYFFCEETEEAIPYIKKFIELKQANSDDLANISYAHDLLGQCYLAEKNADMALQSYEKAIEIYPSGASAWHNKGLCYMTSALQCLEANLANSIEFFNQARDFLEKALTLCCDCPQFLQSLAGWHKEYIEVLERMIESGSAVQEQEIDRHFDLALDYYRKALPLCTEQEQVLKNIILSNLTNCLVQYGQYLFCNQDYEKSRGLCFDALTLEPGRISAIHRIAMCFFKQDCFAAARQYFSLILDKTNDHEDKAAAWLNIACTHRFEENWDEAEEALNQAEKLTPEDPDIAEERTELQNSKSTSNSSFTYS